MTYDLTYLSIIHVLASGFHNMHMHMHMRMHMHK